MTDPIRIRAALKRLVEAIDELVGNSAGVAKLGKVELTIWPELLVGWQRRWLGDAIDQAREALAEACRADPADEPLITDQLLTTDDLRQAWNAQAGQFNGWDHLGLDEQLEWAQRQALRRLAPSNLSANVDDVENLAARQFSGEIRRTLERRNGGTSLPQGLSVKVLEHESGYIIKKVETPGCEERWIIDTKEECGRVFFEHYPTWQDAWVALKEMLEGGS